MERSLGTENTAIVFVQGIKPDVFLWELCSVVSIELASAHHFLAPQVAQPEHQGGGLTCACFPSIGFCRVRAWLGQPIRRYFSMALLNRLTFIEKDALSGMVPEIIKICNAIKVPHTWVAKSFAVFRGSFYIMKVWKE
jgi:hypothetical protein